MTIRSKGFAAALFAAAAVTTPAGSQELQPENRTVVAPIAPPTMVATTGGPGELVVTPVPGVAAVTRISIQKFTDYDRNGDGVYNPMEFAQALYFLATSDPVAGSPALPAIDRFVHRGSPEEMTPQNAVALLNATADELAAVDQNGDWRISRSELISATTG